MDKLTPTQIADALGVSGHTIRRHSGRFARFLSDGASPPKGRAREYTRDDAAILATILRMQNDEKLNLDEIEAALSARLDNLVIPDNLPVPAPGPDRQSEGVGTSIESATLHAPPVARAEESSLAPVISELIAANKRAMAWQIAMTIALVSLSVLVLAIAVALLLR